MNNMKIAALLALTFVVGACNEQSAVDKQSSNDPIPATATKEAVKANAEAPLIAFEKFELDNGLSVVLHVDRSDPVVAVALTTHVGSSREVPGRTGFAHLFEHLLFLESENLGKGGLDKMSSRIGGSGANGSTSRDLTNYFQTVPKDALEKMLWAEADKLGWFINTVTEPVLAKEKQVVKNEKRQRVDNAPYGHVGAVVDEHLFPEGHPYSWQVIGSLEDLQNATLDDVKTFFRRWYVPNNVTLSIAGDFDPAQTKRLVEKYFAEIPRGQDIAPRQPQQPSLDATIRLYYEDNFARLPELRLTWPTVPGNHPDEYALAVLTSYLTAGKSAPFHQGVVDEKKLASGVSMFNRTSELAGSTSLLVRAFPGTDLNTVQQAFDEAFARFEREGIPDDDLARIKTSVEVGFYGGIGSVLGKAIQLARYDILAGDPGMADKELAAIKAVTKQDVTRVYNTYIKDRPYIATSFVPKGSAELVLADSRLAPVVEEQIVQGAEEAFDASVAASFERTPSTFDRSVEPPYGEAPMLSVPDVWRVELNNGLQVLGIENDELPLVQFVLRIEGGQLLDSPEKVGVASLLGDMMNRGTRNKTPVELEAAIETLGASVGVAAGRESFTISGSTLARNFDQTMALVQEMLLEPRWDVDELELAKLSASNGLDAQLANPNAIAANEFNRLFYGEGHILSQNILGTKASIEAITMDDLKAYHDTYLSPSVAALHFAGDITAAQVQPVLSKLQSSWLAKDVAIPSYPTPQPIDQSTVYFYDLPGAKQSVFRFGYALPAATHNDHYEIGVMNYILGGGGFASRLTQQLREGKGYTYRVGSAVGGNKDIGRFIVSSSVRSNVTLEAAELVRDIMSDYGDTFSEQDLAVTKSFLTKSGARALETLGQKLGMLVEMSTYGKPASFIVDQQQLVTAMTVQRIQVLAKKYVRPDAMTYLIVGDAESQRERMLQLGYGDVIAVN
ncbi:MAG: peptidase M16 [Lysobacteraceae bacterium]|nr:MAG: peptidase M16 [Xanthomonadaceae bacterium]